MYDDAYTLQMVEKQDVGNFNFVAGTVPFLFNLIQDVRNILRSMPLLKFQYIFF